MKTLGTPRSGRGRRQDRSCGEISAVFLSSNSFSRALEEEARGEAEFEAAGTTVLAKNADLYKRLA